MKYTSVKSTHCGFCANKQCFSGFPGGLPVGVPNFLFPGFILEICKKNNAISVYMSNYTTTHKYKYTTICYNFSMSSAMYISKTKGGSHGFTGLFRTTNPYSVILT
jgi:hypothetical protein